MKIKNIFCDLDNTLIDTSRGIVECCRKENPKMDIPEYGTVELDWKFTNYNLPKDYWKYFANAKAYKKEYIIEDAITTLKILKDRGYRLFVLTRSNMGLDMKMSKLWEYFPFMDGAIFLASYNFEDKTLVANDDESILIDDKPETMVGRKHGILFGEYQWNKEARESGEYICAKNWKEVLAQIEKIEDNIDK